MHSWACRGMVEKSVRAISLRLGTSSDASIYSVPRSLEFPDRTALHFRLEFPPTAHDHPLSHRPRLDTLFVPTASATPQQELRTDTTASRAFPFRSDRPRFLPPAWRNNSHPVRAVRRPHTDWTASRGATHLDRFGRQFPIRESRVRRRERGVDHVARLGSSSRSASSDPVIAIFESGRRN